MTFSIIYRIISVPFKFHVLSFLSAEKVPLILLRFWLSVKTREQIPRPQRNTLSIGKKGSPWDHKIISDNKPARIQFQQGSIITSLILFMINFSIQDKSFA